MYEIVRDRLHANVVYSTEYPFQTLGAGICMYILSRVALNQPSIYGYICTYRTEYEALANLRGLWEITHHLDLVTWLATGQAPPACLGQANAATRTGRSLGAAAGSCCSTMKQSEGQKAGLTDCLSLSPS